MPNSNQTSGGSVLEKAKQFESLAKPPEDITGNNEVVREEETNESDDDNMDFAELVRNISGENQAESGEKRGEVLREAFKILDHDEDGFISVSDMIIALETFDDDEDEEESNPKESENESAEILAKEMIDEGDFDGDGKISFDDFIRVLADDEGDVVDESKEKKKKKKKRSHK